jgi:hypothetical protein
MATTGSYRQGWGPPAQGCRPSGCHGPCCPLLCPPLRACQATLDGEHIASEGLCSPELVRQQLATAVQAAQALDELLQPLGPQQRAVAAVNAAEASGSDMLAALAAALTHPQVGG